jgi:hypothetical protein
MMRHLLVLALITATLIANAQPQWQWAKRDSSNYSSNPSYPRQVLATTADRTFWGVMVNKKLSYAQADMGDNTFRELDSAGRTLASFTGTGKFAMLDAHADAAGNWYVLGTFYDSIALGPTMMLTRDPMGISNNYYIFRLHAQTLQPDWLQLLGNNYYSSASSFTIVNNRMYMPVDSSLSTHIYQYDLATGIPTKLWTQKGRSTTSMIQADSAGNIYLIGSCVLNGPLDFNGSLFTAPSGGQYPWYIARYHANGQYHWHYYLTDITCTNRGLKLYGNNELYLSGGLSDSTSLGSFHFNKPASLFNQDFLIARLDSSGGLIWAQQRPITSTMQGGVYFNTQFNTATIDSSFYLFCETAGNSIWGGSGVSTSTNNRHLVTMVRYDKATGNASWAKTVNGLYTTAQHVIDDGVSLWITGNGRDSNALIFDTVSLATSGVSSYLPYVAKMQVGTKKIVQTPPTGIAGHSLLADISVSPNPATGILIVNGLKGKESIALIDVSGRVVVRTENQNSRQLSITTNSYPNGVYFLEVSSSSGRTVRRIVLE